MEEVHTARNIVKDRVCLSLLNMSVPDDCPVYFARKMSDLLQASWIALLKWAEYML